MGGYKVIVRRKRGLSQKFHVVIASDATGEPIFWSENYRDKDYAVELAKTFASHLGAGSPEIEA